MTPSFEAPDALLGEYLGRLDAMRVAVEDARLQVTVGDTTYPARMLDMRSIELGSPLRESFMFVPRNDGSIGYLRSLRSGATYYRNEPDCVPPSRLPDHAGGHYAASVLGVPFGHYLLEQDGAAPVLRQILRSGAIRTIRLRALDDLRFISTMGEILDLTGEHPRYANIPLLPINPERR
jgi:hypothetical protein